MTAIEKLVIKSSALLLILVLVSCSNQKKDTLATDIEQQKEELIEAYEGLERDVDDAIDDLEDKLNINEGPVERSLEEAKADLEDKKSQINESLDKVRNASKQNWASVKNDISGALDDLEKEFNELKENINSNIKTE